MSSSKGSEGWKSSPSDKLDGSGDVTGILAEKGSMPPTGAKVSNDRAASVAGGERELLVEGEG